LAQNDFIYLVLLPFGDNKVRTINRIGPHNQEILSVLVGATLSGFAHGELRNGYPRFSIHKSSNNREYLNW
jgi:hypothetical protein